jgi:hypothetical protein
MSVHRFDNVPVSVRSSADGGSVAFGVEINGGFFPFHWMPAGGFDDDLSTIAQDAGQYAGPAATTAEAPAT